MELTMSRATLSLAVLIAIVCCADAMNYLAFPRMGRSDGNYLAFPRMGRSGEKVVSDSANACCGIGLKEEFVLGDDGKEQLRTFCASTSKCCAGLKEIMDEKPDGLYYYMCVPDILAVGRR